MTDAKIKKKAYKELRIPPTHTAFVKRSYVFHPSSAFLFLWSLMMKMELRWSWAFFGWLSPSRVLSAGILDMSPFPSARISASALGQSRSVSHSAGFPWCDLWCMNPGLPAKGKSEWESAQTREKLKECFSSICMSGLCSHWPLYKTGWRCIPQRFSWLWRPSWTVTWFSYIPHMLARIPDSPRWTLCAGKLWMLPDHLRESREEENKQEESWLECHSNVCSEF